MQLLFGFRVLGLEFWIWAGSCAVLKPKPAIFPARRVQERTTLSEGRTDQGPRTN